MRRMYFIVRIVRPEAPALVAKVDIGGARRRQWPGEDGEELWIRGIGVVDEARSLPTLITARCLWFKLK